MPDDYPLGMVAYICIIGRVTFTNCFLKIYSEYRLGRSCILYLKTKFV